METRKAIKIATVTAIAASAFTAVAPAQSEAAASLTSQIKTAKATIKKPYDTYYIKANDTKPASFTKVKNELAAAKKSKTNINAAIKKANLSTKQKNAYYAQIKAYDQYITRAQGYVNAVSINVRAARNELTAAVEMGKQSNVLSAQTALNKKIAEFERAVAKVYGKYTRPLLTSYYATPAKKQAASVDTEMKVYTAYKQIESGKLITTNPTKAGELIDSVKADVEKLRDKNTLLAKNIVAAVVKNNIAYEATVNVVVDTNKPYVTKVGEANLVVDGELVDFDAAAGVAAEFAGTAFTLIDDKDNDPNTLTLTYDTKAPIGDLPSLTFNDKAKLSSIAVNGIELNSDLLALLLVKAGTTSVDSLDLDTIFGGADIAAAAVAKNVSVTLENASGYTSTYTIKLEQAN